MCGRVYMAPADPELRELVKEMNRSALAERFRSKAQEPLNPQGEIAPSAVVPVLAFSKAGYQRVFPMKWGFSLKKSLLINARIETASEKPTFRELWLKHRCVIPASWYFEWEHTEKGKAGQQFSLKPEENGLIWLAGLYRIENDLPCFVILTQPAEKNIVWIHDRMPLMFPRSAVSQWINPNSRPKELIGKCCRKIMWQQAE